MLQTVVLAVSLVAILSGFVLFFHTDRIAGSRAGRMAVFLGVLCLPSLALLGGLGHAMNESRTTAFCLSCHEMTDHGRSLFVDDRNVMPAVHYQRRLIDRDTICYDCHTDYAMFGEVKTKINGLRHLWVHYLAETPDELAVYAPYPNANCLHCHDDARGYLEAAPHHGLFEQLQSNERSCLDCHGGGHALDRVEEGDFWLGQ
jgi:cytochrome c-type protein NapC